MVQKFIKIFNTFTRSHLSQFKKKLNTLIQKMESLQSVIKALKTQSLKNKSTKDGDKIKLTEEIKELNANIHKL